MVLVLVALAVTTSNCKSSSGKSNRALSIRDTMPSPSTTSSMISFSSANLPVSSSQNFNQIAGPAHSGVPSTSFMSGPLATTTAVGLNNLYGSTALLPTVDTSNNNLIFNNNNNNNNQQTSIGNSTTNCKTTGNCSSNPPIRIPAHSASQPVSVSPIASQQQAHLRNTQFLNKNSSNSNNNQYQASKQQQPSNLSNQNYHQNSGGGNMPKLGITSTTSSNHQNHNHLASPNSTINPINPGAPSGVRYHLQQDQQQSNMSPTNTAAAGKNNWQDQPSSIRWPYGQAGSPFQANNLSTRPMGSSLNGSVSNSNSMIGQDCDNQISSRHNSNLNTTTTSTSKHNKQTANSNPIHNLDHNALNALRCLEAAKVQNQRIIAQEIERNILGLPNEMSDKPNCTTSFNSNNYTNNHMNMIQNHKRIITLDSSNELRNSIHSGTLYLNHEDVAIGILTNQVIIPNFSIVEYHRSDRIISREIEKIDSIYKKLGVTPDILHLIDANNAAFLMQHQQITGQNYLTNAKAASDHLKMQFETRGNPNLFQQQQASIQLLQQQQNAALKDFLPIQPHLTMNKKSDMSLPASSNVNDKGGRSSQSPSDDLGRSQSSGNGANTYSNRMMHQNTLPAHQQPGQYLGPPAILNSGNMSMISPSMYNIPNGLHVSPGPNQRGPGSAVHLLPNPLQQNQFPNSITPNGQQSVPIRPPPRANSAIAHPISSVGVSRVQPMIRGQSSSGQSLSTSPLRQPPAAHQSSSARSSLPGFGPNSTHPSHITQISSISGQIQPVAAHSASKNPKLPPKMLPQDSFSQIGQLTEINDRIFARGLGPSTMQQASHLPKQGDCDMMNMMSLPPQTLLTLKQHDMLNRDMKRSATPGSMNIGGPMLQNGLGQFSNNPVSNPGQTAGMDIMLSPTGNSGVHGARFDSRLDTNRSPTNQNQQLKPQALQGGQYHVTTPMNGGPVFKAPTGASMPTFMPQAHQQSSIHKLSAAHEPTIDTRSSMMSPNNHQSNASSFKQYSAMISAYQQKHLGQPNFGQNPDPLFMHRMAPNASLPTAHGGNLQRFALQPNQLSPRAIDCGNGIFDFEAPSETKPNVSNRTPQTSPNKLQGIAPPCTSKKTKRAKTSPPIGDNVGSQMLMADSNNNKSVIEQLANSRLNEQQQSITANINAGKLDNLAPHLSLGQYEPPAHGHRMGIGQTANTCNMPISAKLDAGNMLHTPVEASASSLEQATANTRDPTAAAGASANGLAEHLSPILSAAGPIATQNNIVDHAGSLKNNSTIACSSQELLITTIKQPIFNSSSVLNEVGKDSSILATNISSSRDNKIIGLNDSNNNNNNGNNSDTTNVNKQQPISTTAQEPPSKYQKLYTKKAWLRNYDLEEDQARSQPVTASDDMGRHERNSKIDSDKLPKGGNLTDSVDKKLAGPMKTELKIKKKKKKTKVVKKTATVNSRPSRGSSRIQTVENHDDASSASTSTNESAYETSAPKTSKAKSVRKMPKRKVKPSPDKAMNNQSVAQPTGPTSKTLAKSSNINPAKKRGKKAKELDNKFLQTDPCYDLVPKNIRCLECRRVRQSSIKNDKSSTSKQAKVNWDDFCRFYEFRKLKHNQQSQIVVAGFSDMDDATSLDKKLWTPLALLLPNHLSYKSAKYIIEHVGDEFCHLVQQERKALEAYYATRPDEKKTWKRAVNGLRELCDVCSTTLFNCHYVCERCGYVVCIDCYQKRVEEDESEIKSPSQQTSDDCPNETNGVSPSDATEQQSNGNTNNKKSKKDQFGWLYCSKSVAHSHQQLILAQIIAGDCLESIYQSLQSFALRQKETERQIDDRLDKDIKEVINSCLAVIDQQEEIAENGTSDMAKSAQTPLQITKSDKYHSWLCNGDLLVLSDPNEQQINTELFRNQWAQGKPLLVRDVDKKMSIDMWLPQFFGKEFGDYRSDLVDCRNGDIHRHSMKKFWEGFEPTKKIKIKEEPQLSIPHGNSVNNEDISNGPSYYNGSPLWRLKDWPPGQDFGEILPSHYDDFMNNLPLSDYTTRTGKLNLACRLPIELLKPDLGPKMYSAYGSPMFPERGTTNLHLDMSDAINVMIYVSGATAFRSGSEEAREAIESILNECHVDEEMKKQIIDEKRVPGALWHIFKPCDADTIRKFLDKLSEERNISPIRRSDPIHDQTWYLDASLLSRLKKEYNVEPYAILQSMGDAIMIPAGAPHQVKNMQNCIKVANDFVSPENVRICLGLMHEFRKLPDTHINQEDKLQIKNILYHSIKESLQYINFYENCDPREKQKLDYQDGNNGTDDMMMDSS